MGWRDYRDHRSTSNTQTDQGSGFNPAQWSGEIQNLLEEIRQQDPYGGCWEWVKTNLAETWGSLMVAINRIDTAFQEQTPGELAQAIASTRELYWECVTNWSKKET